MLRRTRAWGYPSTYMDPAMPRALGRVTPKRLELVLTYIRERKKTMRYYGSFNQRSNDRLYQQIAEGGVKSTRYIVSRTFTRSQYAHPGYSKQFYDIRTVRMRGPAHAALGGFVRDYSQSILGSTDVNYNAHMRVSRRLNKQSVIDRMEEWGTKYVLLDEVRKPSVEDALYHRHKIYPKKFYWSPDPETNADIGDADYKWKGIENISYHDYGAHTPDERNRFKSLWLAIPPEAEKQEKQQHQEKQQPGAAAATPVV